MEYKWIRHQGSEALVIFSLGWGTDYNMLTDMAECPNDLLAIYDHTELIPANLLAEISVYTDVKIVAWSMGVFAAEVFVPQLPVKPTHLTAINGTSKPVDDVYGIAVATVNGTYSRWSDGNNSKFNLRMVGGRANLLAAAHLMPKRTIGNQKDELGRIIEMSARTVPTLHWNRAFIGSADAIFLPPNQQAWWQGRADKVTLIDGMPHLPFMHIKDWSQLI